MSSSSGVPDEAEKAVCAKRARTVWGGGRRGAISASDPIGLYREFDTCRSISSIRGAIRSQPNFATDSLQLR